MMETGYRIISGGASVFLDVLRLGASLTVFYLHARNLWFPNLLPGFSEPGDVGHAAVVVFFVLSGYVIAHTTTGNNRGPKHYAVARLSRLYSVVLPALALAAVVQVTLFLIAPALAAEQSRSHDLLRYFLAGSFLNEVWFLSAAPRIESPLWSLSFEFWYYTIFGFWFFRPAGVIGLLFPLAACLVAGPKILVMMPLWIFGFVAYHLRRPQLPPLTAWGLVGISLAFAALPVMYLQPMPFGLGHAPLFYAGQFLTDWVTGLFIATALWIMPTATLVTAQPKWIANFRQVADLTFPLYVLHFPILLLWQGLFGQRLYDANQLALAFITVLVISSILGIVLEKQRLAWTSFFAKFVKKLASFTASIKGIFL